jgi:hypothetical protein
MLILNQELPVLEVLEMAHNTTASVGVLHCAQHNLSGVYSFSTVHNGSVSYCFTLQKERSCTILYET